MRTFGPRNRGEEMSAIAFGLALCSCLVSFVASYVALTFWGPGRDYFFVSGNRAHQWDLLNFGASFLISILVSVLAYRIGKKLLLKPQER
jgi:hypothetical protein